ncbi:MAG: metal ABC transporter ATP-binding protein [Pseudomonadota bacterium]
MVGWQGKPLLPPVDLGIRQGDFWAVIGRNGSGKSTWFKTLLGLTPPIAGSVDWVRTGVALSYVPQRNDFDPLYPATAWDVVTMGTQRGLGFLWPRHPRAARDRVERAFEAAEAVALKHMAFCDLSEGQKQRVMLARVVASEPVLALLDEPTAAMDVRAEEETLQLIDRLRRQYNMGVVIVSHFLGVAARYAEHVMLVDKEHQSVRVGPPAEVLSHVDFATAEALAEARGEAQP